MRRSGLAAVLLLAGCAGGVPVERQVVVPGGRFDAVRGEASLVVRTFLAAENRDRREVLGATCDVVSSLYATRLVTPARLVVPNFGPQSPELTVTCRAGDLAGTGSAAVFTRWQEPPGAWGYPFAGPYMRPGAAFGWGWYGPAYPVSDYPNLNVTLR